MQSMETAVRLMQAGRFGQAQVLLEQFVRTSPDTGRAHWLLGGARLHLGDPIGAEQAVRTAIRLDGGNASSLALLGEILRTQGRLAEAEAVLRQALAIDPAYVPTATNLARALLALDRASDAHDLLKQAIKKAGPTPDLLLLRAQSLLAMADYQHAIPAFRQAVAAAPGDGTTRIGLAAALADNGDHAAAEETVRQAMALGQDNAQARFVLARTLVSQRRYEEAEQEFRKAIRLHPGYLQAHINLAETLWMRTGDVRAVADEIDASLEASPSLTPLRVLKAKLLEASGDSASALTELDAVLAVEEANPALHVAASQAAVKCDAGKALRHASRAMQLGPMNPLTLTTYGNALLAAGHASEAEALADRLLAANPRDGLALAMQATAWRMLGDPRYRDRYDYARFVRADVIDTPDGWTTLSAYLDDLSNALLELHARLRTHPIGQSLRHGTQADLALQHTDHPAVRAFAQAINGPIKRYMETIGRGSDPLRQRNTGRYKLSGAWSVRLRPNGYHFNHFHPEGWLSSACYIHLPAAVGSGGEGWLQFGEPAFPTNPPTPPEYFVRPEPGSLVLFPSWFWHGTVPFSGADGDYRLTIAFDVIPG